MEGNGWKVATLEMWKSTYKEMSFHAIALVALLKFIGGHVCNSVLQLGDLGHH